MSRIAIPAPNPLSETQTSLGIIRRKLREIHPGSFIEIKEYIHLPDLSRCTARIVLQDNESNWCSGSVIAVGNLAEREANAELAAIAMCCIELNIPITFGNQQPENLVTASPMVRFDRDAVLACRDVAQVIFRMKQYGMDTAPIQKYQSDLKKQKKRLTKWAVADFLFPKGSNPVYVRPSSPEAKVKAAPVKKEEPRPEKRIVRKPLRTGTEAQAIIRKMMDAGVTYEDVRCQHGELFGSMLNFALFATPNQINQVSPKITTT